MIIKSGAWCAGGDNAATDLYLLEASTSVCVCVPMEPSSSHLQKHQERRLQQFRELSEVIRPTLQFVISCERCDDAAEIESGAKKIHLIRHGEGYHNVASAAWTSAGNQGTPYTIVTDHEFKFMDAELTPLGISEGKSLTSAPCTSINFRLVDTASAVNLQRRTALIDPDLLVVSL